MKKVMAGYCSVAAFLAASLFSGVLLADWQVYLQDSSGKWRESYLRPTQEKAAEMAKIDCSRSNNQVKLVNLDNGEEQPFACDKPAPRAAPADTPGGKYAINNCRSNLYTVLWADCDCIAKTLRAMPPEAPKAAGEKDAIQRAKEACPADQAYIESHQFETCKSVLSATRGDAKAESICHCVAKKTAADYIAKPEFNLAYTERLRRAAFDQCQ